MKEAIVFCMFCLKRTNTVQYASIQKFDIGGIIECPQIYIQNKCFFALFSLLKKHNIFALPSLVWI